MQIITACKQSLGQGNVFTPVCHPVYREVVCIWVVLHPGGFASTGSASGGRSASRRSPSRASASMEGFCLQGEVCPRGFCIQRGLHSNKEVCLQGGLPPRAGRVGQTPPPGTTGYGQQAGGTHPAGMHSCYS